MQFNKIYTVFKGTEQEFTGYPEDIAHHFHMSYATLYQRVQMQHMSLERAINFTDARKKLHTIFAGTENEFTGTLKEISSRYHIRRNLLTYRLKKGLSLEEAIFYTDPHITTVFKGTKDEYTGTKQEIAYHFHISYGTIATRMNRGMTLEEAISRSVRPRNQRYTVFAGTDREFTGTRNDICKHFSLSPEMLANRLSRKLSLEEAIDYVDPRRPKYTVFPQTDNEFYGNKKEIATHFNISYENFRKRMYSGYTIDMAVLSLSSLSITVLKDTNNEYTGTLTEIMTHFHLNRSMMQSQLKQGLSIEQIIVANQ